MKRAAVSDASAAGQLISMSRHLFVNDLPFNRSGVKVG
ncbi:hypothetical protein CEV34_4553 [Brucella pseudogrignonensis]|uniref:Uncharacterized protein n=1 Tax=Brucella pseudogrignonensis TaxID=419475 RepID=A0A256G6C7_9HYPH|nr:hypothetical protein CEV34_4553 [Brucella pseudogrignonensis]